MESGVSTATQVRTALLANISVASNVTVTITGIGSNPQVAASAVPLSGGINAGSKKAAQFNGDVDIQGNLSFSGAIALGRLSAYYEQALADGGGAPASIHQLISAPTVADNVTVANADLIGVNTASLINIGENSVVTTGFLGIAALGLPAVLSMKSGSSVDRVSGATFALSLDGSATGGTAAEIDLCRAIAIPNGVTTVDKLVGYSFDLPFGDPATESWGLYFSPDTYNWMKGSLKIGGTAGSTDKAGSGLAFDVDGASRFNGDIGFYNTTPVTQQASSGPQTAGAVYTSTEQTMLQEMYDALRTYGLLT
jgi:hypothetical protein